MKRKSLVAAMLCVGVATTLLGRGKGSSTSPLQMTIVDDSSYAVASDGFGLYTDHTVNGTLEDTCVSATTGSNGFTQISLNYLIQTGRKTSVWCNPYTSKNDQGFESRTWSMVIADSTACTDLGAGAEPCTFIVPTQADERILPGSVFSSTSTPVTFQFELNGSGYSVQSDGSASVTGDTSTRTLTYSGTAKLYHSGTAISESFSLPFQLVITKE
jgi:hypothetical protein